MARLKMELPLMPCGAGCLPVPPQGSCSEDKPFLAGAGN